MIIDHNKLHALTNRIVTAGGSSPAEAAIVAEHLVEANLRGHDSHGVGMLVAYVRESDAPSVHVGQALHFTVLAYPTRVFPANISYVATSLDTGTRRLIVRATIDNSQHLLRPEMFASVTILTGEGDSSLAVPQDSIIYDGKVAHVWVARADKSVERRDIKTGLSNGYMIQVTEGLRDGETVVSKGSLFVDRAAAGS